MPPAPSVPVCGWRPDLLPTWRLEHACAVLRWYGIAVLPALGDDTARTGTQVRATILTRFPEATGTYCSGPPMVAKLASPPPVSSTDH